MARSRADVVADLYKIFKGADEAARTSVTIREVVLDSAQIVACEIALDGVRDAARELEQLIAKSRVLDAISIDDESTQRARVKRAYDCDNLGREPERKRARTFGPSSIPGKVGYCPQSTPADRATSMLVVHATCDPTAVQHSFAACIKNALARGDQHEADIIRADLSDLSAMCTIRAHCAK